MELRQLRYFATVARTLNFTEASRQLYITQGTLSQQLRQLEFELGSDLFTRTSRSVELTEAGEALLPLAEEMIRRAGYRPYRDIAIEFTGIRPGEKLNEELGLEKAKQTNHAKIYMS